MARLNKVSLRDAFASFDDLWQPRIVATIDDFALKAVKIEGEFIWHRHAENDELFLVTAGRILMRYRDENGEYEVAFGPGEVLRVPKGVEHMPVADAGTELLLFETAILRNTGEIKNERSAVPVPLDVGERKA